MSYFEIGITSGSQELVRKMRMGYNLRTVLESCRMLADAGFRDHVSVNYSFNVIDERPETIRQTVAYHRELEAILALIWSSQRSFSSVCSPTRILSSTGLIRV